ncbi:uncharacterized protein LOC123541856 [Mercenaria mercenaria]|uniref:uncharacterized protein LOC123541856 n=1 Tax=Mercenaria mercenaria TaxID=6596 RepID=UPI00234F4A9E|nr:uncharacterized protein LOC123541856 [Mercenaria mercenaria]
MTLEPDGAIPPPGPPLHLSVVSDVSNIGVQWEPPAETYGNIRNYIVSWAVLPNFTDFTSIIDDDVTMSIIPAQGLAGQCGKDYSLFPESNVTITFPEFQKGNQLQPGVICTWTFKTLDKYSLGVIFHELKLSGSAHSNDCFDSYIDISGIGRLCNRSHQGQHVRTDLRILKVTLKTGRQSGGQGFKITIRSVVLLPGPPSNIKLRTSDHAIIISWQPPRENTLSITAYRIRYGVIAQKSHYLITVGHNMRYFAINTKRFEGKLMEIYLSAVIGMEQGKISEKYFARATCRRRIHLNGTNSVNITSPGYPRAYPSNIICTWYITSENNVMSSVTYLDFRLEYTSFCSSDYVTFSLKNNAEHQCSRMKMPKTVYTVAQNFTVTFVTDGQNEFAGFCIQIKSEDVSVKNDLSTTEGAITKTKYMDDSSRKFKSSVDRPLTTTTLMTSPMAERNITSPPKTSVETTDKVEVTTTIDTTEPNFTSRNNSQLLVQANTDLSTMPTLSNQEASTYDPGVTVQYTPNVSPAYVAELIAPYSDSSRSKSAVNTEEKGSEDDNDNPIVLAVILSLISCGAVFVILTCCVRWRRRHEQRKINVETAGRYQVTNIELHDILRNQTRTGSQYSNYRACVSEDETVYAKRYLESIPEYHEDCLHRKKDDKKNERKRCNSFPFCFSARRRKIHKEIQNSLTLFGFIEDKQALERTLNRRYHLQRTNSL